MTSHEYAERIWELFQAYRDDFGLAEANLVRQCDFEEAMCRLRCEYVGHIGSDQCGKPEHDLCFRCGMLKSRSLGKGES